MAAAEPRAEGKADSSETRCEHKMKADNVLVKPGPSFDEPIEILKACHERVAAKCATLEKLVAHLPSAGADTQAQQAAVSIMRYFDKAAPHHHADEEQDLFPMLIEAARRRHSPAVEQIASLLDDHRSLEATWAQLRAVLVDIADGKARPLERALVDEFVGTYRAHMAVEEGQIFPLAEACLNRDQFAVLSASMVARRTIKRY
jgi:hemerythrin-like domain-containing protein